MNSYIIYGISVLVVDHWHFSFEFLGQKISDLWTNGSEFSPKKI